MPYTSINDLKNNGSKGEQAILESNTVRMIQDYIKNPQKKRNRNVPKIPDGSPIGMN